MRKNRSFNKILALLLAATMTVGQPVFATENEDLLIEDITEESFEETEEEMSQEETEDTAEEAQEDAEEESEGEEELETEEEDAVIEELTEETEDLKTLTASTDMIDSFAKLAASKERMAVVLYDGTYIYSEPDHKSSITATLTSGYTVYAHSVNLSEDGNAYYGVTFFDDGVEKSGYINAKKIVYSDEEWIAWAQSVGSKTETASCNTASYATALSANGYSDIDAFPTSYQKGLSALKARHPNWIFVPLKTGLDFNTAIDNEMGNKSWIQSNSLTREKGFVGAPASQSGWYYATRAGVQFYMDPRNSLTEDRIFQFEQLTYNATYHTESAIQTFLNSTFMKGAIPGGDMTYANAFFKIGSARKVSPIHLASRVYQEQGAGTSPLISGKYSGYEGYYNYFNVGASGSNSILRGLQYAKQKGWDTRYKSLSGGADTIGNNYILKEQDTTYLEKFNVAPDAAYATYTHQYMQNIQAPTTESFSTRDMYINAGTINSPFVFKIPVYNSMGGNPVTKVTISDSAVTLRTQDTVVTNTTGFTDEEKEYNRYTYQLAAEALPKDADDSKKITWSTKNKNVATVSADGLVTAVGPGTTNIVATANGSSLETKPYAVCKVTVIKPTTGVQISGIENNSELLLGQKDAILKGVCLPEGHTDSPALEWISSDESKLKINGNKLDIIGKGKVNITLKASHYSETISVNIVPIKATFMYRDGTKTEIGELACGNNPDEETYNQICEKANNQNPDNHIFVGWFTAENGTGERYTNEGGLYAKETILYPYYQEAGDGFFVMPLGSYVYTGAQIKPAITVYNGKRYEEDENPGELQELIFNKDYTVSYANNVKVNLPGKPVPTITIKGKGNYAGSKQITFDIVEKSLAEKDIVIDDIEVAYNGKVIKSSPVVWRNGKKLVKGTDYTIEYPVEKEAGAYKNEGVWPITVRGKGGYTGAVTVNERITREYFLNKASVASIPKLTFDPLQVDVDSQKGMEPKLTVKYGINTLTEGVHYEVIYANNCKIGKASATIIPVPGSGYTGSKTVYFNIVGTAITKAKLMDEEGLNPILPKDYTGDEEDVKQTGYRLVINDYELEESTDGIHGDYVVKYTNIGKVGTAKITFTGINAYSGAITKNYSIRKRSVTQTDISFTDLAEDNKIAYYKNGSKPEIEVTDNGRTLVLNKDYTVKYINNRALTTDEMPEKKLPGVVISGKGNYSGNVTKNFVITDGNFQGKISITAADFTYTGKKGAFKSAPVLKDANGIKLQIKTDYSNLLQYVYADDNPAVKDKDGNAVIKKMDDPVSPDDIPQAGTNITVRAKGVGAYAGSGDDWIEATYKICKNNLSKVKVAPIANKKYRDGRPVKLTPEDLTITFGKDVELEYGIDYVIDEATYTNNINKGTASVYIKAINDDGNWCGTKQIKYKIGTNLLEWFFNL